MSVSRVAIEHALDAVAGVRLPQHFYCGPEFVAVKNMALKSTDLVGIHLRERLFELLDEALIAQARGLSPRQKPADRFGAISPGDNITLQSPRMHRQRQLAGVHP